MPIATPRSMRDVSTGPRRARSPAPGHQHHSSQTINAAIRSGFAEAGSDGIIQVSTAARNTPPARRSEHGHRLARARRVRRRGRQELLRQHRAPHRPLPEAQARRLLSARSPPPPPSASGRRAADLPVARRDGWPCCWENPPDRRGTLAPTKAANIIPRSRSASSVARRVANEINEQKLHPCGRARDRRGPGSRRERAIHGGP